jgi:hypothetical protein
MELNSLIKRILKEEFTSQMCKAPEVNERLKEYKYYRVGKCSQSMFNQTLNDIKKIKNYSYNIIQSGKFKGKKKSEVLTILNNEYNTRLKETCGGIIFKGNESNLRTIGTDPCTIPSVVNDYKNAEARKAYNKNMGHPENEDIFSGGPIAPTV